ncbi:TetR/AcrR family transcriptional regulator [Kineococcus indalonis]|uniref:TetR/AcrR family transcriptional regulator n=1 Tax=Kineococcus indalonis TaxID=2696566 RepID=UPI00196A52D9|nr:TetR/AcrR family transcriptional regulator [Kineococcus indalonis]
MIDAATRLLGERPEVEPTTRSLYEAAGVTAPTLYHHFGDKDGLIEAVLDEAFARYLERKHAVPRSEDLVADFAAGWDMHVRFGLDNPLLYRVMYGSSRRARAAAVAEAELLADMHRLEERGVLRVPPALGVQVTLGFAVGCVMHLLRTGGAVDDPVSRLLRNSLIAALTGLPPRVDGVPGAARQLLAVLADGTAALGPAETALLRQWLTTLAG